MFTIINYHYQSRRGSTCYLYIYKYVALYNLILFLYSITQIPIMRFKMNSSFKTARPVDESSLQGYLDFSSLSRAALMICTCQVC